MATVTAFRISGLQLWFWSNDHEPPHFHAKRRGEWEVTVNFLLDQSAMIEIEGWSKKQPPKRLLEELTALTEQHRVALLAQWQAIRDREHEPS